MNKLLLQIALPIIQKVIEELMSPENIQKYGDRLFDFVEDAVKDSKTTIDDTLVLPLLETLRKSLNIPDLPEEK